MRETLPPDPRFATYADFWPHYLREHAKRTTRNMHFAGTALAALSLLSGFVTGNAWFFALALIAGYGPAWLAHFFVENNRPATFTHPLWSLVSDFRMAWYWLRGGLDAELRNAGVAPPAR